LSQHTVNLNIEDTYQKLKTALIEAGCKVTSESPPSQLSVQQGSLWGVSSRSAKKNLNLTLEPTGEKTTIKYSSKLSSDWKNITIIGCILAFVLAVVCVWMATDLGAYLSSDNPGFWSWLITTQSGTEVQAGEAFVHLAWGLAAFLFVIIAAEAVVYVYAGAKIETFAAEIMAKLG
jgi:hypothetical protein